ncbi:MAG: hypothetical protein NT038_05460 [Euryarchaeota archaeon]|nr:hypothetical protein [Euryarchaeota archaeon]
MKKIIIAGGCIFAILILILASIPVTANPQTTTTIKNIIESNLADGQNFLKNHKLSPTGWLPGDLIDFLINLLIGFYMWLVIHH